MVKYKCIILSLGGGGGGGGGGATTIKRVSNSSCPLNSAREDWYVYNNQITNITK